MFLCGHWLSLYKEDGQITRELFGVRSVRTLYEIVTVTGDLENAETDSRVFITLYGKTGITPRIELASGLNENPFRKGRSSKFVVKAPLVGPIVKLKIVQDGSGTKPDWFLERIVVTDLSHPKWTFFFPCQSWISARYSNTQLMKILHGFREPTGHAGVGEYHVTIYTADRPGAGTTSDVFLQMYGTNGFGRQHWLRIPESSKDKPVNPSTLLPFDSVKFARGSCIRLRLEPCQHLGELNKIRIGHNNKGRSPSWFLDKLIIDDLVSSRVYQFNCNRWMGRDEEDGKIVRILECVDPDAFRLTDKKVKRMHCEIRIKTGNVPDAATSARTFIRVHGPEGKDKPLSSPRIWLNNAHFERGRTEIFNVDIPTNTAILSPFTSLDLGHDNSGPYPAWFVDKVGISCRETGVEQTFICGLWLSSTSGDRKIERTLAEDKTSRVTIQKTTEWLISVHTSDLKLAGTDALVYCKLYGNTAATDTIPLTGEGKHFHQNSQNEFRTKIPNIGIPTKLRIWHDNTGPAPGWHLDYVKFKDLTEGAEYLFTCNHWLSYDDDDHTVVRELVATGPNILNPETRNDTSN
ncbi:Lipoxygenase y domain-containing protein 1 [Cichlidogyrus casuarinus]|uniref:Lipoxygenase y domain-containing protein 1 n=1 Tax=Cichlidogyrus casuarinus TaxID=1844966 RepID=A0ABD2QFI6_9PLAT